MEYLENATEIEQDYISKIFEQLKETLEYTYNVLSNLCYSINKLDILKVSLNPFSLAILLTSSNLTKSNSDYVSTILMIEELATRNSKTSDSEDSDQSNTYEDALYDSLFNITIMHLNKNYSRDIFRD